ncbi:MAG: DUF4145 domain-containing protein [Proteobacteria bacterium]|nr:DUF4145 domain-containing protein [Pseudomonadota bacterium]
MADPFNWVCPYCDRAQTVSDDHVQRAASKFYLGGVDDMLGYSMNAIVCVNPECKKLTVDFAIVPYKPFHSQSVPDYAKPAIYRERAKPRGQSQPQPDYIPLAIRNDYIEACLIRQLSPKASATLARRCLQGMIRDFCGISKSRLIDEIEALRKAVDEGTADRSISVESVNAIDDLRNIGNIGAHMERDINQIVDVDPGEAQAILDLIEGLFKDWYVERHKREQRFTKIAQIKAQKDAEKAGAGS